MGEKRKSVGGKAPMSVAEGNVSLATELPKYQLPFSIKDIGAVARMILQPAPEMSLWARTRPGFLLSQNSSNTIKK